MTAAQMQTLESARRYVVRTHKGYITTSGKVSQYRHMAKWFASWTDARAFADTHDKYANVYRAAYGQSHEQLITSNPEA
jgi:hypothetical protein